MALSSSDSSHPRLGFCLLPTHEDSPSKSRIKVLVDKHFVYRQEVVPLSKQAAASTETWPCFGEEPQIKYSKRSYDFGSCTQILLLIDVISLWLYPIPCSFAHLALVFFQFHNSPNMFLLASFYVCCSLLFIFSLWSKCRLLREAFTNRTNMSPCNTL